MARVGQANLTSQILEQISCSDPLDFSNILDIVRNGMVQHLEYILKDQRDLVLDCRGIRDDQSFYSPSLCYIIDLVKPPITALNVPNQVLSRWQQELGSILFFDRKENRKDYTIDLKSRYQR